MFETKDVAAQTTTRRRLVMANNGCDDKRNNATNRNSFAIVYYALRAIPTPMLIQKVMNATAVAIKTTRLGNDRTQN